MNKIFYILFYFFALTFMSCGDMDKNIKNTVNDMAKDAQAEMMADLANSKVVFDNTYKKILNGSTDTFVIKKITKLYLTINETSKYIDSKQNEISKLDDKDFQNNELIKKYSLMTVSVTKFLIKLNSHTVAP